LISIDFSMTDIVPPCWIVVVTDTDMEQIVI